MKSFMSHIEGFKFCVRGMRSLGKFLSVEMTSSDLLGTKISLAAVRTWEGGSRPEQGDRGESSRPGEQEWALGPGWSGELETPHSLRVGWRQNQQNMATDGGRAGREREVEDDARVLSEGPAGHTEGVS